MRHPLHPALVHFPVACWSLATAADIAGFHFGEAAWRPAGQLLIVGTLLSIPALLAGFYELTRVADDSTALRDVYWHMGAMSGALMLYAASLLLRLDRTSLVVPGLGAIACSALGFLALGIGGWLGGKLVYTHRLGGDTLRR
jgi:uncharacterized membrane protein